MKYLATPYSHPDPAVKQRRFEIACSEALRLMIEGHVVFSPIAHSHAIETVTNQSNPHEFWMRQDFHILSKCDTLVILLIDGWDQSRGVREEIEYALLWGIPLVYLEVGAQL